MTSALEDRQEAAGSSCGQNRITKNVRSWKTNQKPQSIFHNPESKKGLTSLWCKNFSKINVSKMTKSNHMQFQQEATPTTNTCQKCQSSRWGHTDVNSAERALSPSDWQGPGLGVTSPRDTVSKQRSQQTPEQKWEMPLLWKDRTQDPSQVHRGSPPPAVLTLGCDPQTGLRNVSKTFYKMYLQGIPHSTGSNSRKLERTLISMERGWDPLILVHMDK